MNERELGKKRKLLEFTGIMDFVEYCQAVPEENWSRDNTRDEFCGGSWNNAIEQAMRGNPELVNNIFNGVNVISAMIEQEKVGEIRDVTGEYFDVSDYLSGEPEVFRRDEYGDREPVVPVYANFSMHSGVSVETIRNRGCAIIALCDELCSSGFIVDLHLVHAVCPGFLDRFKEKYYTNIKVGIDPLKVDNKVGYRTSQGLKAKKLSKRAKAIEVRQTKSIEEKEKLLKDFEHIPGLSLTSNSHHSKTLVELKNVSLFYGDKTVCKDINFSISQGERVNICGKNGSGKSTLLKLIIGNNISHTGTVFAASNLKISYVNQDTSSLCGTLADFAENNGIDQTQFLTILRKLDFSREQFEKDIKDFSGGQKKKVLIAKSLCEQAHLYVWDEPTNFIDIFSRMQIENLLKECQPTLLFVDHDKTFCQQVATKTINI